MKPCLPVLGMLCLFVMGCTNFTPIFRQSYDQTETHLYIECSLAISKYVVPNSNGALIYSLMRAHWGNTPEDPSATGDFIDDIYVESVTKAAFLRKINIVVGIGQIPSNRSDEFPPVPRFFVLNTKGSEPTFALTFDALKKSVPEIYDLKESQLMDIAIVFDRLSRIAKKEDPYSKR